MLPSRPICHRGLLSVRGIGRLEAWGNMASEIPLLSWRLFEIIV